MTFIKIPELIPPSKEDCQYLARALYNLSNASKYMELLNRDRSTISRRAKKLFARAKVSTDKILRELFSDPALSDRTREFLREEIGGYNSLTIESIIDNIVLLNNEQKEQIESIIIALRKGEIKVVEES